MNDVPKVVLEQLEIVRMQGRCNMIVSSDVQVAANGLGFSELVCFIEDLPRRGGWMPALRALGDFTTALIDKERDDLQQRLAEMNDGYQEEA